MRPIVIIPARMAARRLPGKPLADIGGIPMVVRVLLQAQAAEVGDVAVACCDQEVADAVTAAGGRIVMTSAEHVSGSDRVWEALGELDPGGRCDVAINLQGDLPDIPPAVVRQVLAPLDEDAVDIGTLVAPLGPGELENRAVVKAHLATPEPGPTATIVTFSPHRSRAGSAPSPSRRDLRLAAPVARSVRIAAAKQARAVAQARTDAGAGQRHADRLRLG